MANFLSSLAASISGFRVVLFLLILLAVAVWLLLKELREKEELRGMLDRALQGKPISPKEVVALEPQLNQVRASTGRTEEPPRVAGGQPIYKIVITGGPCGGKSTSLTKIQEEMGKQGFRVFSVP